VAGTDRLHRWALPRRRAITVGGERVWVAPPEYVIIRRLEYLREGGSDKHARDIRAMVAELGEGIDFDALRQEVGRLRLTAQWEAIARRG
jgi:hypothetical protein